MYLLFLKKRWYIKTERYVYFFKDLKIDAILICTSFVHSLNLQGQGRGGVFVGMIFDILYLWK